MPTRIRALLSWRFGFPPASAQDVDQRDAQQATAISAAEAAKVKVRSQASARKYAASYDGSSGSPEIHSSRASMLSLLLVLLRCAERLKLILVPDEKAIGRQAAQDWFRVDPNGVGLVYSQDGRATHCCQRPFPLQALPAMARITIRADSAASPAAIMSTLLQRQRNSVAAPLR